MLTERQKKIEAIKKALAGRLSGGEVTEPVNDFFMVHNGVYTDLKTGKEYTEKEYCELTGSAIVFKPAKVNAKTETTIEQSKEVDQQNIPVTIPETTDHEKTQDELTRESEVKVIAMKNKICKKKISPKEQEQIDRERSRNMDQWNYMQSFL